MSSKMPPIPPENLSDKGPDNRTVPTDDASVDKQDRNLDQQGRQGNSKQNTTNQGYQTNR